MVGSTALIGLQAHSALQTISLSSLIVGYAPGAVPVTLAAIAGLEVGFLDNDVYGLISGQALGEDLYDWLHKELPIKEQSSCR
jgi:hypothetical protein